MSAAKPKSDKPKSPAKAAAGNGLTPTAIRKKPPVAKVRREAGSPQSSRAESWVKSTLRKMTLEEKIGQLVMIPYFGRFTSEESPEFRTLAHAVEKLHVGCLIVEAHIGALGLERSRAYPTAAVANLLQARAKIPLLIAADFERGTAYRLEDGTAFPHAMAVAATGRAEDAYAMGRITALEARSVGVQWVFAPVADVSSDPANPVINVRSFGEDPRRVGECVAAYVRGVEEHGCLATAKHFPGHGDTNIDSHLNLPTIKSDRAHLENVELPPFRSAIAAGVSTIMTGHLAVPALEPEEGLPTTFSRKITTDLLRRELHFKGLIATDDLSMGGVSLRTATGEAAVLGILSGSDVLLVFKDLEAAIAGLREAAQSGRLPMARIDDAVARVLRAKAQVGLHRGGNQVSLEALPKNFALPESRHTAEDIANHGITVLRDESGQLPLDATRPRRVLLVAIAGDPDRIPGMELEDELRWRVDDLQVHRADKRFSGVDRLQMPRDDSYDLLIVALFVRAATESGSIGLLADQAAFVHRILATGKPTVVVSFGSPYLIAQFPEARTWLAAFSSADVAQRAAGRAMFGQIPIGGKIPVSVPGTIPLGAGIEIPANPMKLVSGGAEMDAKLAPAYALLDQAVKDRAFPGGVLATGFRGGLAVHAFGKLSYEAGARRVTPTTIYDAASLTKPVVTATLTAMLEEAGQISLDAPVARYLPEWSGGPQPEWRTNVTVRHLLTHSSGLPAHKDYFKTLKTRREIAACAVAEPLESAPGTQSVYSDLGFILLGEILTRLTGRPLGELARERIFTPLGMDDTQFHLPKSERARTAPTENDAQFRKRLILGEVHDENAYVMGGAAGHAGVFTTAPDLAVFCQMLLNGGIYAHRRLLRRTTIARYTAADGLSYNTRTPGWMVPTANSSSGRYFSAHSFGHTGFTGVSVWIDPDKELFVVLLTNRVNPTRENEMIQQVRPALHDAVAQGLGFKNR